MIVAVTGTGFSLVRSEGFTFVNPAGDPRPYTYALFRRAALTAPAADPADRRRVVAAGSGEPESRTPADQVAVTGGND